MMLPHIPPSLCQITVAFSKGVSLSLDLLLFRQSQHRYFGVLHSQTDLIAKPSVRCNLTPEAASCDVRPLCVVANPASSAAGHFKDAVSVIDR